MKTKTFWGLTLLAMTIAAGLLPSSSRGQAGASAEDPLLSPVIEEITKQQATILDNQTQIETKLAVIAEDIRIARIYVGRGGGKTIGK